MTQPDTQKWQCSNPDCRSTNSPDINLCYGCGTPRAQSADGEDELLENITSVLFKYHRAEPHAFLEAAEVLKIVKADREQARLEAKIEVFRQLKEVGNDPIIIAGYIKGAAASLQAQLAAIKDKHVS